MKNLITILSVLIVVGCGDSDSHNDRIEVRDELFSKEQWKKRNGDLPFNHRLYMLSDLKKNHVYLGMPRVEIYELLGEPKYDGERMITYIISEDDNDYDDDLWVIKLKFLLSEDGQKVIKIHTAEEMQRSHRDPKIYRAIRKYAESHFDTTNYILMEGTVGKIKKYFVEGEKYYEQKHLGVPIHKDSLTGIIPWTYYQLNANLEVVSYSRKSKVPVE